MFLLVWILVVSTSYTEVKCKITRFVLLIWNWMKTVWHTYQFLYTLSQKRPANFFSFLDRKEHRSSFVEFLFERWRIQGRMFYSSRLRKKNSFWNNLSN